MSLSTRRHQGRIRVRVRVRVRFQDGIQHRVGFAVRREGWGLGCDARVQDIGARASRVTRPVTQQRNLIDERLTLPSNPDPDPTALTPSPNLTLHTGRGDRKPTGRTTTVLDYPGTL